MSRRKPEKKPQQFGSIFSVPIDLKSDVVLPGAAKHAKGTVPLGVSAAVTDNNAYFFVDLFYGEGIYDESSIGKTESACNVRISVSRILDRHERKSVATDTMRRIIERVNALQPPKIGEKVYSMETDSISLDRYVCSDPGASNFNITVGLGEFNKRHIEIPTEEWETKIWPFMWVDGNNIPTGVPFKYEHEASEKTYNWELVMAADNVTPYSPFRKGLRFKVVVNKPPLGDELRI
eukprot:5129032-Prymnesium_polylepis.1